MAKKPNREACLYPLTAAGLGKRSDIPKALAQSLALQPNRTTLQKLVSMPANQLFLMYSGYLTMFSLLTSETKKAENTQEKNLTKILGKAHPLTHVATGLLTLLALPAHLITTGLSHLPSYLGYFFYGIVRPGAHINYYLEKRKKHKKATWDNSPGYYDYFLRKIRPSLMIAFSGLSSIGGLAGITIALMHSDVLSAAGHYLAAAGHYLATGHWNMLQQMQPTVSIESILITWLAVGLLINYISQVVLLYNKISPEGKSANRP
jgi:hypothetical protein